CARGRGGYW
nr:immunoglobulin heavy chain junction region [Homo sapiens]MCD69676.1 immunoglobulin heavy chain junction region [Homo sapiens]